jgi:hypothetical protein
MTYVTRLAEQRRQPGDVRCNPPCIFARQQLCQCSPAGVIIEIDIGERLTVSIPNDDAAVEFFDGPWRRKAAGHGAKLPHTDAWYCALRHTASALRFSRTQSAALLWLFLAVARLVIVGNAMGPLGESARPSGCRCCSRRPSVRRNGRLLVPVGPLPGLPHDAER